MLNRLRLSWAAGLACVVLMVVLLALFGPLRISVSLSREESSAAAAPARSLATETPGLPTATPEPTQVPATATSAPPTNTAEPATATSTPLTPSAAPTETPEHKITTSRDPEPTPEQPTLSLPTPTPPPEPVPDVVIRKQADHTTARPGDTVLFTLTAHNAGQGVARDVVVTDAVPAAFEVTDLKSGKGDVVLEPDGQTVTAYPRTLDPGETVTIEITAKVRSGVAGAIGNMAIITTSTPGDDPGNNTSIVTITIQTQEPPPNLPKTADPELDQSFVARYWPLLVLIVFLMVAGAMMRYGLLRRRLVTVSVGLPANIPTAPAAAPAHQPALVAGLDLDAQELYRRWRAGESIQALTRELSARHPQVAPTVIAMTVQRLISDHARQ